MKALISRTKCGLTSGFVEQFWFESVAARTWMFDGRDSLPLIDARDNTSTYLKPSVRIRVRTASNARALMRSFDQIFTELCTWKDWIKNREELTFHEALEHIPA